jgi:glycerol-3-phosphate acyltransferase PlsY
MLKFFALPLFAYLLGSIPWGLVITRMFTSVDIRQFGSGNIGATNVRRVAGTTLGILTLTGDTLKGAVPVWLAVTLAGSDGVWAQAYISLVALCAVGGHLYPVFLKFKGGGKGVATAGGCFLVMVPEATIIAILVFIMCVCFWNRVSVGSLAAAAALPVVVWQVTHSEIITGCAILTAAFIYIRHKDNIKRLWSGTEPTA